MPMNPTPFPMVKECKGAALAILVLMAYNTQHGANPVTQEWLERNSGYTDKPVSSALKYLSETGRILETALGFVLPAGSIWGEAFSGPGEADEIAQSSPAAIHPAQEPLSPEIPLAEAAAPTQPTATDPELLSRGPVHRQRAAPVSRKFSDSTTTSALNPESLKPEAEEEGKNAGIFPAENFQDGVFPTRSDLKRVEANLVAFKKWGVGRNQKTIVISARPDVTPEQIEALARQLMAEKRFSTGLLVTAVGSGDQPVPDLPTRYAARASPRDPAGYASWEE